MRLPRQKIVRSTMDDVARAAGVSRATVSRVMTGNSSVSEQTIEKVNSAVVALGYIPNAAAQNLAGRRNDLPTVGLLLRDPANAVYGLLFSEIQKQADLYGFQLVATIPTVRGSTVDELGAIHRLIRVGVDSVFLATGTIQSSDVDTLLDTIPMISVGRPELHDEISAISYDEEGNGKIIAEAVIDCGHQDVGLIMSDSLRSIPEYHRTQSILRTLRAAGINVHTFTLSRGEQRMKSTKFLLGLVQEKKITVAMFPSDRRALAFIQAASIRGIQIPRDLSVTGIDGISHEVKQTGLATVRLPVESVAARAAQIMASRLENSRQTVVHEAFPGVFVSGASLVAPPLA